jgi:Spy/CpxP family protein refolding chaperone
MRSWITILGSYLAGVLSALAVFLLMQSLQSPKTESVAVDPSTYTGRGGGGPGGFGGGGPGFAGRMQGRDFAVNTDPLASILATAGEVSLNADQKQKVQAVAEAFKTVQAAWQKEHEVELNKLRDEFRAAADAGGRDKIRELMQKRQDIQATAPKTDDTLAKIKAVLTPDQLKNFERRLADRQAQSDPMRGPMNDRFGGGPGGPGGPGGGRDRAREERPATQPARILPQAKAGA